MFVLSCLKTIICKRFVRDYDIISTVTGLTDKLIDRRIMCRKEY